MFEVDLAVGPSECFPHHVERHLHQAVVGSGTSSSIHVGAKQCTFLHLCTSKPAANDW